MDEQKIKQAAEAIRNAPHADADMLAEIQDRLHEELKKPVSKQDNRLIDELTEILCDASGATPIAEFRELEIAQIMRHKNARKTTVIRRFRPAIVLCACLAVVLGINAWTVHALDLNVFQTVYRLVFGGVSVQLGDSEAPSISLTSAEDDPYGIRGKCEEYGYISFVPQYLPEGFVLQDLKTDAHDNVSFILFDYRRGDAKLTISYLRYTDADKWSADQTEAEPEDGMTVSEETIGEIPVQFRWNWRYADAGFTDAEHQIVCGLSSEQLGIEELRKIVYSMFA